MEQRLLRFQLLAEVTVNTPRIQYLILHTLVQDVHIRANFILIRKLNVGILHAWECASHLVQHRVLHHALVGVLIMHLKTMVNINLV